MGHKRIGKDDDGFKYAMVSTLLFFIKSNHTKEMSLFHFL